MRKINNPLEITAYFPPPRRPGLEEKERTLDQRKKQAKIQKGLTEEDGKSDLYSVEGAFTIAGRAQSILSTAWI